ncbi:MAG: hypothetical protein CFE37_11355 [Alphaproteobacteria bacterium PA4]|nr:MAG: hypothetical protein CFE37_11355 [Alphaproteobacteria bacterium PA4]
MVTRYPAESFGDRAGLLHIRGFHPLDDHYGAGCLRQQRVTTEAFVYTAADRAADGDGAITLSVRQLSASVGPGDAASITL